jgi:hypothetical protein
MSFLPRCTPRSLLNLLIASLSFDRARKEEIFTIPGSKAEQALASKQNGINCKRHVFFN